MSKALEEALGSLSASDKRALATCATEANTPWLGRLLAGLAIECARLDTEEIATLHAHEREHDAEVERLAESAEWPENPLQL
ncbi:hypothetical protein JOF29_007914 [Kribbella aluminosa]|uniref:Uncharacterized protein n=1 Tax=Kribbella aluminosa TaxID=416017 RepID=A0ABS4UYS1_9ACTN|nr:hypothetical protein [Kribbella aluminosa]MBP2356804.1 hypothetical protein [Kribbella aluminosa]